MPEDMRRHLLGAEARALRDGLMGRPLEEVRDAITGERASPGIGEGHPPAILAQLGKPRLEGPTGVRPEGDGAGLPSLAGELQQRGGAKADLLTL
jgi:hypothetical protein